MNICGWWINGLDAAIFLTIPIEVWLVFWVIGPAQDRWISRKAKRLGR